MFPEGARIFFTKVYKRLSQWLTPYEWFWLGLLIFLWIFWHQLIFSNRYPNLRSCNEMVASDCEQWKEFEIPDGVTTRRFKYFKAKNLEGKPLPTLIMYHHCLQSPEMIAMNSRVNFVAEQRGFHVLYPQQEAQHNQFGCFNWFKPKDLKRESGELAAIVKGLDHFSTLVAVDKNRVYAGGFYTGGMAAGNLAACFPDRIAAVASMNGIGFGRVQSDVPFQAFPLAFQLTEPDQAAKLAQLCGGNRKIPKRAVPTIFVLGREGVWAIENSNNSVEFHQRWQDLADDGVANNSVRIEKKTTPFLEPEKYPSSRSDFFYNGQLGYSLVEIENLSHSWSGGPENVGDYSDPKGPEITSHIFDFLSNYTLIESPGT